MFALSLLSLLTRFSVSHAEFNFVALGNFGGEHQSAVASTLKLDAKSTPFALAVSPGSSFSKPLQGLDDPKWQTEFLEPYAGEELNFPLFPVAGEADWSEGRESVASLIAFTARMYAAPLASAKGLKWSMKNLFYDYRTTFADVGDATVLKAAPEVSVLFIFLDTHSLRPGFEVPSITEDQLAYVKSAVRNGARGHNWVFVVGDAELVSSGSREASSYLGSWLRPLLRENHVDAYISGRSKNLEIVEDGDLTHVVCGSGAAAKAGKLKSASGSVAYAGQVGYCRFRLTKQAMTVELVDGKSGAVLHSYAKKRTTKPVENLEKIGYRAALPTPADVRARLARDEAAALPRAGRFANKAFMLLYGLAGFAGYLVVLAAALTTLNFRFGRWMSAKTQQLSLSPRSDYALTEKIKVKQHAKKHKRAEKPAA